MKNFKIRFFLVSALTLVLFGVSRLASAQWEALVPNVAPVSDKDCNGAKDSDGRHDRDGRDGDDRHDWDARHADDNHNNQCVQATPTEVPQPTPTQVPSGNGGAPPSASGGK
jgi:hypothetical protein